MDKTSGRKVVGVDKRIISVLIRRQQQCAEPYMEIIYNATLVFISLYIPLLLFSVGIAKNCGRVVCLQLVNDRVPTRVRAAERVISPLTVCSSDVGRGSPRLIIHIHIQTKTTLCYYTLDSDVGDVTSSSRSTLAADQHSPALG